MDITSLRKSISEMTDGEIRAEIISNRFNRRSPKAKPRKLRENKKSISTTIGKASIDELEAMLKKLEG